MKQIVLTTLFQTKDCTGGILILPSGKILATLERPWLNNLPKVSCIPDGVYKCSYTESPRFKRKLYEVHSVPSRSGIRIHPANYVQELEGCIALGENFNAINGSLVLNNSRKAMDAFHTELAGEQFNLVVKRIQ